MPRPTEPGYTPGDDPEFRDLSQRLLPGRTLWDRYRLVRRLGAGGFGVVWLARDEALNMDVALKFLAHSVVHSPEALDDLKRETRMSLRLTHPSIVRIYGFHSDDELAAISMEFVDGRTLSALRRSKPSRCLEAGELAPLVGELCAALDYAHDDVKIVHRDLKPGNLMLSVESRLKVTDFGISSTISETQSRLSMRRSSAGTPAYMSPQQMLGKTPTISDDIYSLGATLFDLLTGKPPFFQGDIAEQVRSVEAPGVNERRRELGITSTVPADWERVIASCLTKTSEDRPATAGEVARLLHAESPASSAGADAGADAHHTVLPQPTVMGAPPPELKTHPSSSSSRSGKRVDDADAGRAGSGDSPAGEPADPAPPAAPDARPQPADPGRQPSPPARPAPEVRPAARPSPAAGTGAAADGGGRSPFLWIVPLLVVAGVAAWFFLLRDPGPPPPPASDSPIESTLEAYRSAVRSKEWDAAERTLAELEGLDAAAVAGAGVSPASLREDLVAAENEDRATLLAAVDAAIAADDLTAGERAVGALEDRHPDHPDTREARRRVDGIAGDRGRLRAAVSAGIDAGDVEAASTALGELAGRFPEDAAIADFRSRIARLTEHQQQEQEQLAHREAQDEIQRLVDDVERALRDGDLDRAAQQLNELKLADPGNARISSFQRSIDRGHRLEDALAEFERAFGDDDLAGAETSLAAVERLRPGDGANAHLRSRLDARRSAIAVELATSTREALARDDVAAASRAVERLASVAPSYPERGALEQEVATYREIHELVEAYAEHKGALDARAWSRLFQDAESWFDRVRRPFSDMASQRVGIENVSIVEIDGDTARVTFDETLEYQPKSGSPGRSESSVTLRLARQSDGWRITELRAAPRN